MVTSLFLVHCLAAVRAGFSGPGFMTTSRQTSARNPSKSPSEHIAGVDEAPRVIDVEKTGAFIQ
jgi:hypothetical protein